MKKEKVKKLSKKELQDKYVQVLEEKQLDSSSTREIELKKAKIPFKTVLKLAIKNLWKKKFRYLVMLLVCAISLAFLSFTIELNGDPLRQNVFTMVENGYHYTNIKRYVPLEQQDDYYSKYNYGDLPENSYSIIKEGVPELTLHKYEEVEINYAGAYLENKNFFYTGSINSIIKYDSTNTYRLLAGRVPKENTQEILITDYLIASLKYFKLVPSYDNYEDYLGMYLDLNWRHNYKVVGIIDSNYEKWVKFSRISDVDSSIKDNYSFINDFKMMNAVVLTKDYFKLESKPKGSYLRFVEHTINLTLKAPYAEHELSPVSLNVMSSVVAQDSSLLTPYSRNESGWYCINESKMPSSDDEIVIPLYVIEKMFNFKTYGYSNNRLLFSYFNYETYGRPFILNITSYDGNITYSKEFKVVGISSESEKFIVTENALSEIESIFFAGYESVMVELPEDPEKALQLFNKAYNLRDEEKGITGYIINVWAYRDDIDSYEVDPFINIISKGGLFVFTVFTIGIMWTIISIEIVDSRKEIGILRSIGLSGVKVSLIFILQTVSVNLIAYAVAVRLAQWFIPLYNSQITDTTGKVILYMYTLTYRTPVFLLIFVLVMTISCTVLPLLKIMRQKIIDVINEREK